MSDETKELDPFKPDEPKIPGVTGDRVRVKPTPQPPYPTPPRSGNGGWLFDTPHPHLLVAVAVVASFLVGLGVFWWMHSGVAKEAQTAPAAVPVVDLAPAPPSQMSEKLLVGPGPIATTTELAKTWSSRRFVFRVTQTSDDVPALVVHLPGGVYWGLSMREPFGTCELEYVTDLQKLDRVYAFQSDHPMIGDPCNHAVFDLTRYGIGLNGEVRGAIVSGKGVRPPLAIEVHVRGKQIVATQIEH